jgi:hypothetical protein
MKIVADEEKGLVYCGDLAVSGVLSETPCPECNSPQIYHDSFDASFCAQCNRWLEFRCPNPWCDTCSGRPKRPLPGAAV